MEMKYFRFLYGETEGCFVHFGELKDTRTEEQYTFLYLRGMKRYAGSGRAGHALFLCPRGLDLVILGSADAHVKTVLQELLRKREIGTLLLPADAGKIKAKWKIREVRKLTCREICRITGAGWNFLIRADTAGSLELLHGLSPKEKQSTFSDCVMNVKALDPESRCCREAEPDGYGCALGCVLYQDYDVCRYWDHYSYVTGTLLLTGDEDTEAQEQWVRAAYDETGGVRFVGIAGGNDVRMRPLPPDGYRRYYIGLGEELDDRTIAEISRDGWSRRPVILRDGQGICCSGLLKYAG